MLRFLPLFRINGHRFAKQREDSSNEGKSNDYDNKNREVVGVRIYGGGKDEFFAIFGYSRNFFLAFILLCFK